MLTVLGSTGSIGTSTLDVVRLNRERFPIFALAAGENDLPAIYNGAKALVFPTWYEGFGLPAAEMLACGGVVLASSTPAVAEVLGGCGTLIDPADQDAWRDSMIRVINEPEWVVYTPSFLNNLKVRFEPTRTVPQSEMLEFIAAGIERINNRRAFDSTVGFAHWDAIESWDSAGLGVTLHQYHYYAPDNRRLPGREYPNNSQCFIGEFATKFHRGWPELGKGDMARTISARLRCVEEKGYPAAFLWSARATDEATMWTVYDRDETVAFLKSAGGEVA